MFSSFAFSHFSIWTTDIFSLVIKSKGLCCSSWHLSLNISSLWCIIGGKKCQCDPAHHTTVMQLNLQEENQTGPQGFLSAVWIIFTRKRRGLSAHSLVQRNGKQEASLKCNHKSFTVYMQTNSGSDERDGFILDLREL